MRTTAPLQMRVILALLLYLCIVPISTSPIPFTERAAIGYKQFDERCGGNGGRDCTCVSCPPEMPPHARS
ncbi:hypothetical protein RSAG8_12186, partial [Rhizoctonia solani AG-8 WAC10335]